MAEKELLLKKLEELPSEINFPRLCSDLHIDYNGTFVHLYQSDASFREVILAHIDRIKYQIIERISNRALGMPVDGINVSLVHARFMLDLITTGEVLPKLSKIEGGKSNIPKKLTDKLKLSNSVRSLSPEQRQVITEQGEEENAESDEEED